MKIVQWVSLLITLLTGVFLVIYFSGSMQKAEAQSVQLERRLATSEAVQENAAEVRATFEARVEQEAVEAAATYIAEVEAITAHSIETQTQDEAIARNKASEQVLSAVTVTNLMLVNIVSLLTFITTTIYRIWDERRTRTTYKLAVAKTELEILKLQKDLEEAQQKDKKRKL